ncbi:hypothetical protein BAUCODRAFT_24320 [Baudoinia panamericana UAMH 10762]|uniref:Uncharacterized protein n=1 Tax=Baudoinia panamericana (strain UAMH 10762) TaxID=717646 RepID=M2NCF9_BAUPA|nr:uncharacterized protein BAUCODRAFT_24320 [Baudoinia panamericana UAMH 10762]EMC96575.1 hypothetical protein BAUCODRAFT_24320 [Baudoinia panamericana UAMH 10762]
MAASPSAQALHESNRYDGQTFTGASKLDLRFRYARWHRTAVPQFANPLSAELVGPVDCVMTVPLRGICSNQQGTRPLSPTLWTDGGLSRVSKRIAAEYQRQMRDRIVSLEGCSKVGMNVVDFEFANASTSLFEALRPAMWFINTGPSTIKLRFTADFSVLADDSKQERIDRGLDFRQNNHPAVQLQLKAKNIGKPRSAVAAFLNSLVSKDYEGADFLALLSKVRKVYRDMSWTAWKGWDDLNDNNGDEIERRLVQEADVLEDAAAIEERLRFQETAPNMVGPPRRSRRSRE